MSKHELAALTTELAAELAALEPTLTTVDGRVRAINQGIRAKYNTRLFALSQGSSVVMTTNIGNEIGRQCDAFIAAILPPADSGLYVGFPRN